MASRKKSRAKRQKIDTNSYPTEIIPITIRADSKPPHQNPIRAFREELRLNRYEFAKLLGVSAMAVRTWETPNLSRPAGDKAVELVDLAKRNAYPLTLDDIYRDRSL